MNWQQEMEKTKTELIAENKSLKEELARVTKQRDNLRSWWDELREMNRAHMAELNEGK